MAATQDTVKVLTVDEAARRMHLSRRTFERHVLPHLARARVGRRILIPVDAVEEFLAERAAEPLER